MKRENDEEDEEELEKFNPSSKEIDKACQLAVLNGRISILKAKFPSSLERIFYMNFVK